MLDIALLIASLFLIAYSIYLGWQQYKDLKEINKRLDDLNDKYAAHDECFNQVWRSIASVRDVAYKTEDRVNILQPIIDEESTKNAIEDADASIAYWRNAKKTYTDVLKTLKGR
jgi:hypothetical protein